MIESGTSRIGHHLMLAFEGGEPPADMLEWIERRGPAGFTLFRHKNVENPAQIRRLTAALQAAAAASGIGPLLIATDQEGGQLVALGDRTTLFPGNMALGATGDAVLARRVGQATGREMAAMGVNVNYAPDSDVNTNPDNPNVGTRAFGDDPALVAEMGVAMIDGLQSAGVAATAKHFPGNGDSAIDPHFGVPVLVHQAERLEEVEFRPFRAAIDAGVRLMMTAHVALPALTGRHDLPSTLSRQIMHDLLRQRFSYQGLLITDALDMHAITQGTGQIVDIIAALRAGVDLLLMTGDPDVQERIYTGLELARSRGLISQEHSRNSAERLRHLRKWLAGWPQPDLSVVGSEPHRQLARAIARRSVTLVRNDAGRVPVRLSPDARVAVIMPRPADLTPADTSSYITPTLAQAIRHYHPGVDEFIVSQQPAETEIATLRDRVSQYNLLVIGTISAHLQPKQAAMVNELMATKLPCITIALRTPYDLAVYPSSDTHICTYSILPATMTAVAAALWGQSAFRGRLPVQISGLYARGHGLTV